MNTTPPYRGVIWHRKQNAWRVKVKKMDHSVNPSRERYFYKEFPGKEALEIAVRVRDYVSRMIHGPDAKLHTDGRLPPSVTRIDVIQWLVKQGTIHPSEVSRFTERVKNLDKPS